METEQIVVDRLQARALALSKVDAAWLAGLIDGEGCFHIGRRKSRPPQRKNPSYRFCLLVTMGCEQTVRRVHKLVGRGSVHERPAKPRSNPAWSWICDGPQAKPIVQQILPFLRTKLEEAEIGLHFLSLPKTPSAHPGNHRFLAADDNLVTQRALLWDEMRCVKSRAVFREDKDDPLAAIVLKGWRDANRRYQRDRSARSQRTLPEI